MGMDVSDVDRSVSLVATDTTTDPHAQTLPHVLLDGHGLLDELGSLDPEGLLQKGSHAGAVVAVAHVIRVGDVIGIDAVLLLNDFVDRSPLIFLALT